MKNKIKRQWNVSKKDFGRSCNIRGLQFFYGNSYELFGWIDGIIRNGGKKYVIVFDGKNKWKTLEKNIILF